MSTEPNSSLPPKALSVTRQGAPDGFLPPMAYTAQVLDGGYTRLAVSTPANRLALVHRALVSALQPPLSFLYVRMTSRQRGQLPKPEHYVAVELSQERVLGVLETFAPLLYHDGRNQIWIRGSMQEQLILEEIGMMYLYPDDLLFRDVLDKYGLIEGNQPTMDARDYVKVNFLAEADAMEKRLMQELALTRWEG